MLIQFNVTTAYISWNIFFYVFLFKISYLALKSTYSCAAQQIRLTSSQLLGTDPDHAESQGWRHPNRRQTKKGHKEVSIRPKSGPCPLICKHSVSS